MRVLIADDHDLVRETLASYLMFEGATLVRTASNLPAALDETEKIGPFDIVLLDWNMPGMDGLSGLSRMIAANDGNPVAILSGTSSRGVIERALAAGAAGFVPKSLASRAVVVAVRDMAIGKIFTPFAPEAAPDPVKRIGLTPRETEVLRGLSQGHSNQEIAEIYGLQEISVKLHVRTLSRKLEARNRTHAALIGRDLKLV